jgi:predicted AAA+ superfamily ATPase
MIDFPESDMCGLVESGTVVAVCYYADWIDYHQMGYLVSFRRGAGKKLFEEYIRKNNYPRVYTEPINKEVEQVYRSWGFRDVAQCDPNFGEYWDEYLVYN